MKLAILPLALLLIACSGDGSRNPGTERGEPRSAPTSSEPSGGGAASASQPTATAEPQGGQLRAQPAPPPYDPSAFTLALEPVLDGFRQPLFVTAPPDGSGRLFVVEQGGTIRVAAGGTVLPEPFLDVTPLVVSGGERGLLGLAFHPRYRETGIFFIAYTARGNGDNTVARYRVSADPNRADPDSATILLALEDFAPNHNGGMLAFGPDGYLYVGTGDGGGGGDPRRNAQNPGALLGKMLRLDVDGGEPYGIPPDNPFIGQSGARPEIWAYGFRNPWRYSFDRASGDLWIGDVGQNAIEEVDLQPGDSRGGENYGWNRLEGSRCYPASAQCDPSGTVLPVAEYATQRPECAVTGGYVYRGSREPLLYGAYFFADYCSGRIWSLHHGGDGAWIMTELLDSGLFISSFGEDAAGELYLTDLRGGGIYRLTAQPR